MPTMHPQRLRPGFSALIAVALLGAPTARADPPPQRRLVFDERYRPFQWSDGIQTGVTLGAYAYLEFGIDYPAEAHWQKPILFDAAVRDGLRAESLEGRRTAAVISDVTWYVPMFLPWVESIGLPLFTDHFNTSVAFQLTALNAQAVSVVALVTRAGHKFIARARPDTEPCLQDPNYDDTCFGGSFASFPSGHTSAALVGAGLSCAHHAYLPLLDGGTADSVVCVAATTLGVTNGIARIYADRHYATDVITGAVLGWGVGYAMPVLLHYEWWAATPQRAWTVAPWVTSSTAGAAVLGLW
jgi:membrane-associated phospholipid phosphatase